MAFGKRSLGDGSIPIERLEEEAEARQRRHDSSSWLAPAIGLALATVVGWAVTTFLEIRPSQPSGSTDGKSESRPAPKAG